MSNTKKCFKCNVEWPLSNFYKHSRMKDGHLNKCKECNKKDVIENRIKRLDYYTEYERLRFQDPERKVYVYKKQKEFFLKNPEKNYEYTKRKRANNPLKYKATNMVNNYLSKGKIIKLPCSICGDLKSQAHHHDYSKPLDITWLCVKHHSEIHHPLNLVPLN